ncbi:hypothetical protein RO3G_08500 [Rhizopus delemar RA 99-880]|uniref:Uncharacterized protein n=1 Tax=Rhizopus delemar (strain RA 99-880 / ATCC MYA-4621 / FGSC 9543 / NRRL 43880) TaxID=246409 RepID=I1C5R5_RHIO9|nr:hypothetical protein RO3G_08500 [Rhizopus delemar RA 99-880]|eukprot:EIE83795.1 hypothetical protein RO3G_08500 [Rhizopus delemar RA 99-880]
MLSSSSINISQYLFIQRSTPEYANDPLSKIENKRPLLKFYEEFDQYPARSKEERIVKNIHKFQKLKDELSIILFYNPAFTSLHTTRTATLKNAQNNHSVSNSDVVCSCLFSERMTKSFCNGGIPSQTIAERSACHSSLT